jgi:NAD(P)-dependent dehydrogenase (short-subunit alcohol dehydrogenase family)
VDFAKAALAAGNAVVATSRSTDAVNKAIGQADDLLIVKLDVTSPADAQAAVQAAVDRFGRIDVLVNNAANFYGGYFEELTPQQIEQQLATGLIGPMNVTRSVLPIMRKQRSGHIISISSGAGLVGGEFGSAYAAAKFGLEGWMESLAPEVAPFGISTTIVNPGFFRTELLTKESATYAEPSIADYAERDAAQREWWAAQNGRQAGDPAKLAQVLVTIASRQPPPRRFIAGTDAIAAAERENGSTLSSNNRAHRCGYRHRRLCGRANTHTAAGCCAADAPRAPCCVARPTTNRRRNTNAYKPTGNQ